MVDQSATLLQARGVGRRVPATDKWLLCDVDLQICAGDRCAVFGPTGSGKTLLLRALALLDPLDAGEVLWRGDRVTRQQVPAFRSKTIYLHQRPALIEGTVEENLRQPFALRMQRDKRFDKKRILTLLESLGRDASFLTKHQRDLSGGEYQIAALLRAIQLDPEMLLLDEPTAAMDRSSVEAVEIIVNRWCRDKLNERAALWVTHDQEQAERVANVTMQMSEGQLERES